MTTQKALPNDLIDSLLAHYKKPEALIGENGLLKQLTKALVVDFPRFSRQTIMSEITKRVKDDNEAGLFGSFKSLCKKIVMS